MNGYHAVDDRCPACLQPYERDCHRLCRFDDSSTDINWWIKRVNYHGKTAKGMETA